MPSPRGGLDCRPIGTISGRPIYQAVSEFERVKIALRRVSWKSKTRRNGRIASLMNSNFRASITSAHRAPQRRTWTKASLRRRNRLPSPQVTVRFSDLQRRRSEMTSLIYNYVEIRMRMLGDNKPKPKPALLGVCSRCKGAGWVCDSIGAISICNGCYNPTCKPAP